MRFKMLALLAALPLAACAADYYGGPAGPGPIAYDGFYDDYYGPIYDGYWGDGDVFYYRTGEHGHFRADRSGHFRHDMPGGGFAGTAGGPGAGGPGAGGHAFHHFGGSMTPPHGGGRHR
ncbi:MAG: hypothetical protein JOY99_07170 [Sphingomonadaceae bacterium]|nr:hypothetical protein [Sphingomonadaceae bacterium]